jgi:hypothetical protein
MLIEKMPPENAVYITVISGALFIVIGVQSDLASFGKLPRIGSLMVDFTELVKRSVRP